MVLSVCEILNHLFQRPRPTALSVFISAVLVSLYLSPDSLIASFFSPSSVKYWTVSCQKLKSVSYLLAHSYIVPSASYYLVISSFSFLLTSRVLSGWHSTVSVLSIDDYATWVQLQLREKPICISLLAVYFFIVVGLSFVCLFVGLFCCLVVFLSMTLYLHGANVH